MVKPSVWPDWLDPIWAKSAGKGEGGEPETLAQHTWYVLERLSEFIRLRPGLPDELGLPRLWQILFWAAFLHDFGKAAGGFQARLHGGTPWPHRHEVLSLAFLDWIAAGFSTEEQSWLAAAIVSHHKDASQIQRLYPPLDESDDDPLAARLAEIDKNTLRGLWRWLVECPAAWRDALELSGLGIDILPILSEEQAIAILQHQGATHIHTWLRVYRRFVRQVEKSKDKTLIIGTLTLRGFLINADHSASAHAGRLPGVSITAKTILESRQISSLFEHQKQAGQTEGSVLLTAPTGSGKTEAALLWAAQQANGQQRPPRLFYTLPYQASMNAMKIRLSETFNPDASKNLVGLQHGRALLAYYRMLLDEDEGYSAKEAAQQSRWAKNLVELNYPPIRVFSPYQMLKGLYRLKGYEALLSDYHQALFIFDEIHAYEVKRLALILKTIQYLRENFQARFMVMSATFPSIIKGWLQAALGQTTEIQAADQLFQEFQRHHLRLLDGDLMRPDNLARIIADARAGKSVLVVCNLVARAQEVYKILSRQLEGIKVELLHGRFNMRDRSAKEKLVRDCAGRDEIRRQPIVLVATQAVEVSLDIDLDTIYTDPAPLEALVQRFGRINRRRLNKNLAQVYVFREWDEKQEFIYKTVLVEKTLAILERENDCPINEGQVGLWLDEIYEGELAEQWQIEYQQAATEFEDACIKSLRAFESSRDLTKEFYKAFDGREVLPRDLVDDYELLKRAAFIQAAELLVPVREGHIHQLHKLNRVSDDYGEGGPLVVDVPYSPELGLDFSNLSQQSFGLSYA